MKLHPAPCLDHYCVTKSWPMTAEEILLEYSKCDNRRGVFIMHYLTSGGKILYFRSANNLYLRRVNNSLYLHTLNSENYAISFLGERVFWMKFLPLLLSEQKGGIAGYPAELEAEITEHFKQLAKYWRRSKETSSWSVKISGILKKITLERAQTEERKSLRKILANLLF